MITVSSSVSRFFSLDDEKNISSTANIGFIGQLFVGKMAALDLYSTGNVGTLTWSVCGHQHKKNVKNELTANDLIRGLHLQL